MVQYREPIVNSLGLDSEEELQLKDALYDDKLKPARTSLRHMRQYENEEMRIDSTRKLPGKNLRNQRTRTLRKNIVAKLTSELPEHALSVESVNSPGNSEASKFALSIRKELRNPDGSLKLTGKEQTARLRLGFLDTYKVSEEDAARLLCDNIIYCDKDILAFNKPSGLPVQDGANIPYSIDSLTDHIKWHLVRLKRLPEKPEMVKIVHRIDQDASGVIVFGLNQRHTDILNEHFLKRSVHKEYWCIAVGSNPQLAPFSGVIHIPIIESQLQSGQMRMRCRSRMVAEEVDDEMVEKGDGKVRGSYNKNAAITKYETLATGDSTCLMKLILETGRKHQARVHMSQGLGLPILGDHKYWHPKEILPQKLPDELLKAKARHIPLHLHAKTLIFPDLKDGRKLYLKARLPVFFIQNMKRLRLLL